MSVYPEINLTRVQEFFQKAKSLKILIVGDIMLDSYLAGTTKRISPEAPVPILHFEKEDFLLGGAGNVAINLAHYQTQTYLATVIGKNSPENKKLLSICRKKKIDTRFILQDTNRQTSIKTRVIAGNQQIVRIDKENLEDIDQKTISTLIDEIKKSKIQFDAIIFSDYGKGVINPKSFKLFLDYAKKNNIYVALDPKQRNFNFYQHLDLMTPNYYEAREAIEIKEVIYRQEKSKKVIALGEKILKHYRLQALIITQGSKGMTIFKKKNQKILTQSFPTFNRSLFDVTGAGDTVIAICVLAQLIYQDIFTAAYLANICAGIVVGKFGVSIAEKSEIVKEVELILKKN